MTLSLDARRVRALALILMALYGIALAGPFGVRAADAQMTSPPSEEKQPSQPRNSRTNPVSGNPEAIEAGRKLYFTWCVQCHGPKADGVSRFGKYAADLREFWRGYREFVTSVKNGRPANAAVERSPGRRQDRAARRVLGDASDRRGELEIA